jgi:hypothetical protein
MAARAMAAGTVPVPGQRRRYNPFDPVLVAGGGPTVRR